MGPLHQADLSEIHHITIVKLHFILYVEENAILKCSDFKIKKPLNLNSLVQIV